jgi:formate hydrogenlyase transcriptional activator
LEASCWMIGGAEGAAAKLGLKRTTLFYKMKKLGISRPASSRGEKVPVVAFKSAESSSTLY